MNAVDTNLLVYAHRTDATFHSRAREFIKSLAEGNEAWAIPWPCVHEFLAVVTNPRIWKQPSPLKTALGAIAAWRSSPKLFLLAEDEQYWTVMEELVLSSKVVGAKVHDARIAALALHHRVDTLFTADRDFGRFRGLRTKNPLL